jgi:hypothetical protein
VVEEELEEDEEEKVPAQQNPVAQESLVPLPFDFKKAEKLKNLMQNGVRASRFTRLTMMDGGLKPSFVGGSRDPTIIERLSRTTNFDYLTLRDPQGSKYYQKVDALLTA